jgi:hypothetical protein
MAILKKNVVYYSSLTLTSQSQETRKPSEIQQTKEDETRSRYSPKCLIAHPP